MRNLIVGTILGIGLGGVGVLLLRPTAEPHQQSAMPAQPALAASPNGESGLTGSRSAGEAVLGRLTSVEAELSRLADVVTALASHTAGATSSSPTPDAPGGGARATTSVEIIRATWSAHLDELEGRVRSEMSRDGANVVLDSHLDDLRRARDALAAAHSFDDFKRLATGSFKNVFKLP